MPTSTESSRKPGPVNMPVTFPENSNRILKGLHRDLAEAVSAATRLTGNALDA